MATGMVLGGRRVISRAFDQWGGPVWPFTGRPARPAKQHAVEDPVAQDQGMPCAASNVNTEECKEGPHQAPVDAREITRRPCADMRACGQLPDPEHTRRRHERKWPVRQPAGYHDGDNKRVKAYLHQGPDDGQHGRAWSNGVFCGQSPTDPDEDDGKDRDPERRMPGQPKHRRHTQATHDGEGCRDLDSQGRYRQPMKHTDAHAPCVQLCDCPFVAEC